MGCICELNPLGEKRWNALHLVCLSVWRKKPKNAKLDNYIELYPFGEAESFWSLLHGFRDSTWGTTVK